MRGAVAPVPVPPAAALLVSGLLAFGAFRRRARRRGDLRALPRRARPGAMLPPDAPAGRARFDSAAGFAIRAWRLDPAIPADPQCICRCMRRACVVHGCTRWPPALAPSPHRPMPHDAPRPNIFVVGDAKCGTTTLYRMLQLAPGIGTSRTRKELHYFSAPELRAEDRRPRRRAHPAATSSTTRPPISPSSPTCPPASRRSPTSRRATCRSRRRPARIQAFAPDARIVILLREPAAKIMSQYTHLWAEGRETLPFEAAFAAERGPPRRGLLDDVRLRGRRPLRRGRRALPRRASAASG